MASRKPPNYLTMRGGIYYFQRGVPQKHQDAVGQQVWKISLKTGDKHEALRRVMPHIKETDGIIARYASQTQVEERVASLPDQERAEIIDAGGIDAFISEVEANFIQHQLICAGQPYPEEELNTPGSLDDAMPDSRADVQLRRIERAQAKAQLDEIRSIITERSRTLAKLGIRLEKAENIAKANEPGLNEVLDDWALKTDPPEQTERQYRYAIRRFIELHGDKPVNELNRKHLADFADVVGRLPRTTRRDIMDLPILQAIEMGEREELPTNSDATRKKHVIALKTMMAHAVNEGTVAEDPFAGYRIIRPRQTASSQRENEKQSFTKDDLDAIFAAMKARGLSETDDDFWIPYIALYQGARQEEICQLEVSDIKTIDGIDCMAITDEGEEQKTVKNKASVRTIPLHPTLIDMGFLDHVKRSTSNRVFYSLKRDQRGRLGGPYGKRFARILKKYAGITDGKKSFHTFRHTWTDAARNAGVDSEVRMRIAGREVQGLGSELGYGTGHNMKVLYRELSKIDPFAE